VDASVDGLEQCALVRLGKLFDLLDAAKHAAPGAASVAAAILEAEEFVRRDAQSLRPAHHHLGVEPKLVPLVIYDQGLDQAVNDGGPFLKAAGGPACVELYRTTLSSDGRRPPRRMARGTPDPSVRQVVSRRPILSVK